MSIMKLVEDSQSSEFYPTPEALAERMLDKVDWNTVESILEPSAGKGDILKALAKRRYRYKRLNDLDIDCIEIDANLRAVLKYRFSEECRQEIIGKRRAFDAKVRAEYYDPETGRTREYPEEVRKTFKQLKEEEDAFFRGGIHIVHDDFLTYTDYKRYQLIALNPPYSQGDRHLLKALELQKNGGQIVCLLNAETIRNPYTERRKNLVQRLEELDADIEYISDAFTDAERKTDVEVALIYVNIPHKDDDGIESIYEKMKKAKEYEEPSEEDVTALEVTDMIKAIIARYQLEVEAGIELIRTYHRMPQEVRAHIKLGDSESQEMTVNNYVKSVRRKYWKTLLTNQKFIGKLPSKLQKEYLTRVESYADYDFSEYNIMTLSTEIQERLRQGIEEEIDEMYNKLTEEHSYFPECQKNRHLYDGWKTNKAWKIDKKCILPCYGVFSNWDGSPRTYAAYDTLSDIERILNFFDGNMTAEVDLSSQIQYNFDCGNTKNLHCKFFDVTFYKKGTVHITFTCPELIDRFNIYAAKKRKWLPPCYGTKKYEDMTEEEQAVVDSFQGAQAYEKILQNSGYYLAPPVNQTGRALTLLF